jgi:hypothetical protein
MTSKPNQDWRTIIRGHTKFQNDASSWNSVNQATKAIHEIIQNEQYNLVPQEIADLVSCLRTILQLWSKGAQSPSNPWSQICITTTCLLCRALSCPGTTIELLSKCSKLVGFTLARSALMGEVMRCRRSEMNFFVCLPACLSACLLPVTPLLTDCLCM